eukprot:scaffold4009_cov124-Cylindrotheca_fusiformis.AAC.2
MASPFSSFHQQIEHLQALLAAAASSERKTSFYDIRQCLRQIQASLLREHGDSLYQQGKDDEVTQDLMTLLALNDEYADPMVVELMNAIVCRAADLIACYGGDELSIDQLQGLLPRILRMIRDSAQGGTISTPAFEALLQLLNQHLPASRISEVLEGNDHDCWVILEIILTNQDHFSDQPITHLPLCVFTSTLLEYLVTYVLPQRNTTLADWIRSQQQGGTYNTSSSTPQVEPFVRDYLERIEYFGVSLVECALHQMEVGATAAPHCEDQVQTSTEDSGSSFVLALQYATVATDFVVLCLSNKESISIFVPSFCGMAKSLWQAMTVFVVEQLEGGENNNKNPAEQVGQDLQLAATQALWKLTFVATTNPGVALENTTSPAMIVVTVMRLLQYPESCWTSEAQDWLDDQLTTPSYRKSLSHALQAAILSLLSYYYPHSSSPSDSANNSKHQYMDSFIQIVLSKCCGSSNNDNSTTTGEDPWQSLVEEYLSDHLTVQETTTTPLS